MRKFLYVLVALAALMVPVTASAITPPHSFTADGGACKGVRTTISATVTKDDEWCYGIGIVSSWFGNSIVIGTTVGAPQVLGHVWSASALGNLEGTFAAVYTNPGYLYGADVFKGLAPQVDVSGQVVPWVWASDKDNKVATSVTFTASNHAKSEDCKAKDDHQGGGGGGDNNHNNNDTRSLASTHESPQCVHVVAFYGEAAPAIPPTTPEVAPDVYVQMPSGTYLCGPSDITPGAWDSVQAADLVALGMTQAEAVAGLVYGGDNIIGGNNIGGAFHLVCNSKLKPTGFTIQQNGNVYGADYGPSSGLGYYPIFG